MFRNKTYLTLTLIVIATLVLSACGEGDTQDTVIQTAVAETVAAQSTEPPATQPPFENVLPTQTPFQMSTSLPTLPSPMNTGNSARFECAKASLQDETIIDGIVLKPGEQFTKTWYIQNTSPCIWDTNYKIIFWDGSIMGGGYYYNLPQVVAPGATIPISLVLTAPAADGSYRSEWKLQTSDNINFGVGMYNAPFYTEIAVSSAEKPAYGITGVNLYVIREPKTGCQPANMVFTAYAEVSTSGPYEFTYYWGQKDGNNSSPKTVLINSSKTTTYTREWKFGRAASQGNKWFTFVITEPVYREYKVDFVFECP